MEVLFGYNSLLTRRMTYPVPRQTSNLEPIGKDFDESILIQLHDLLDKCSVATRASKGVAAATFATPLIRPCVPRQIRGYRKYISSYNDIISSEMNIIKASRAHLQ